MFASLVILVHHKHAGFTHLRCLQPDSAGAPPEACSPTPPASSPFFRQSGAYMRDFLPVFVASRVRGPERRAGAHETHGEAWASKLTPLLRLAARLRLPQAPSVRGLAYSSSFANCEGLSAAMERLSHAARSELRPRRVSQAPQRGAQALALCSPRKLVKSRACRRLQPKKRRILL